MCFLSAKVVFVVNQFRMKEWQMRGLAFTNMSLKTVRSHSVCKHAPVLFSLNLLRLCLADFYRWAPARDVQNMQIQFIQLLNGFRAPVCKVRTHKKESFVRRVILGRDSSAKALLQLFTFSSFMDKKVIVNIFLLNQGWEEGIGNCALYSRWNPRRHHDVKCWIFKMKSIWL